MTFLDRERGRESLSDDRRTRSSSTIGMRAPFVLSFRFPLAE